MGGSSRTGYIVCEMTKFLKKQEKDLKEICFSVCSINIIEVNPSVIIITSVLLFHLQNLFYFTPKKSSYNDFQTDVF